MHFSQRKNSSTVQRERYASATNSAAKSSRSVTSTSSPARPAPPPPLLPLRAGPFRDRHADRHPAQDFEGDMHLGGAMALVLPQRPGHPRQGRQQAAIDGRQVAQRRLLLGRRGANGPAG